MHTEESCPSSGEQLDGARLHSWQTIKRETTKDQTISKELSRVPKQTSRLFIGLQKYPAPDKIKCTMSVIWWKITGYKKKKITGYAKEQDNTTQYEKKQSINSEPELAWMWELANKEIEVVITVFHMFQS